MIIENPHNNRGCVTYVPTLITAIFLSLARYHWKCVTLKKPIVTALKMKSQINIVLSWCAKSYEKLSKYRFLSPKI
jgi:hypothetical protein